MGGEAGAIAAVAAILAAADATRIGFSDSGLVRAVAARLPPPVECLAEPDAATLLRCDAGLTSADAAIAETGSLLLDARAERHRLLSLVPPVHIALVPASRLVGSLGDAFGAGGDGPGPAWTLITGPSRTADIELTLVVGVHGPRALHVVVLTDC